MEQGCDLHGDDRMRECSMCGVEFCYQCFPGSVMCPGCASQTVDDDLDEDDDDEDADFEDARHLDDLLDFDDMIPPGGAAKPDGSDA